MKAVLLIFLLWAAGSYACYYFFGTGAILPYAGVSLAAAGLLMWRAARKPNLNNQP